jgi:hypothetical protein
MNHLSQRALIELLEGRLAEDRAREALGHLATCGRCGERLQALRAARGAFGEAWDRFEQWLATGEGSEWEFAVAGTKEAASQGMPFTIALRVLIDGAQGMASVGRQVVRELVDEMSGETLGPLTLCPAYSGVGDPDRVVEAESLREEASTRCAEGNMQAARAALEEAKQIAPQAADAAEVEGALPDGDQIQVSVNAARGTIAVVVRPSGRAVAESPRRAVLLDESRQPVSEAPLEPVEGADYLLAEFENVGDGSWIIGL